MAFYGQYFLNLAVNQFHVHATPSRAYTADTGDRLFSHFNTSLACHKKDRLIFDWK
jgi:hypothetical protein